MAGNGRADRAVFQTFDLRGELTKTRLDSGDVHAYFDDEQWLLASLETSRHSLRRGFVTNAAKKKVPLENNKMRDRATIKRDRPWTTLQRRQSTTTRHCSR